MIIRGAVVIGMLGLGSVSWAADAPKHETHAHEKAIAHPHDPVLQAEHMDLLHLVPADGMTHVAIGDGRWSEPATWKDRQLPGADARVHIPRGKTITLDVAPTATLRALCIDGSLRFAPDRDTTLVVDTIVVPPNGELIVGTPEAPIARECRARIVFADRGPIDTRWDPNLLSRGLIAHGVVSMVGTEVTPYVTIEKPTRKGDTKLTLSRAPTNWKRGDRLVLTGTSHGKEPGRTQDEERSIVAISGTEVTVEPLEHDHTVPAEGLSIYVANLDRNVRLESQNADDLSRRGHVMFMHSPKVKLSYAGFYNLGRTDKRITVNDPRLDENTRSSPAAAPIRVAGIRFTFIAPASMPPCPLSP